MQVKRDVFTFPISDLELIQELKLRCMKQGIEMNKSEIVRAGLHALEKMNIKELTQLASEVPKLKTGRPARSKK